MKKALILVPIALTLVAVTFGQAPTYQKPESPVPVVTGFGGFTTAFEPGQQQLQPTFAPIVLVPFGENWLIEAEGEFEGSYIHRTGQPWEREWNKGVGYLQADWFAGKYVTVVGGRFLVPFGIFNERLHSGWIRNIPADILIGPMGEGSANGGMLRGGIPVSTSLNLNYSAYFSAGSTARAFEASRQAGGRVGFFFPGRRVEIGFSFKRTLDSERFNTYGFDWTWQLNRVPLDIRGEFDGSNELGKGYWLEGAYRMRRVPFAKAFMQRSQAVVRAEQYFRPSGGPAEDLPAVDTTRTWFGWNYWVRPDLRASVAYGRNFSSEGDRNLWQIGITYRFALPLPGGGK